MINIDSGLFSGFTDQQLEVIHDLLVEKEVSTSQRLISVTQYHSKIFVLVKGGFQITRHDDTGDYVVASLEVSGDFVGCQSLWGGKPIANVRVKKGTRYYELDVRLLDDYPQLKSALIENVAQMNFEKLHASNESVLSNLKRRIFLSKLVSMIFLIVCLSVLYNSATHFLGFKPRVIWSWVYMLIFMPLVMVYIRYSGEGLEYFGVTTKRWKQSLLDSLIASVVFLIFFVLLVYFLKGQSLNHVHRVLSIAFHLGGPGFFLYLFHCYAQEFLARGIMQTGLCKLISVENSKLRLFLAICMASLAFGVIHAPFGFPAVVAVIVFGIIFGYVYVRTGNLIGVTLFHCFSGKCFFALLIVLGMHPGA